MRIACVTPSAVPATTANSIQALKTCRALAAVSGPVCLWAPCRDEPLLLEWAVLADRYGLGDGPAFEFRFTRSRPALKRYDFTFSALAEAQRWRADLVYTWLPQVALLALQRGLPAVLEVHDLPTGRLGPWLFRRVLHHPVRRRILVITAALRSRLAERFGPLVDTDAVMVAPNGVTLEQYAALPAPSDARRELGLPEQTTAVYSGHFYAGRGMDLLLSLARALPQVQFLWVGGRPADVDAWRARLQAEGLTNVVLTGFVPNRALPRYQAAGDMLLMPYEQVIAGSSGGNSAEICSPMKMFDYLAAGRAIVTSELPVLREVLNESNAVFCPPADTGAWQAAVSALANDPTRRGALGSRARADSLRYSWEERASRALSGFVTDPTL